MTENTFQSSAAAARDPDEPATVTLDEIGCAAARINEHIVMTSCRKSHLSEQVGLELYLKHEFLQYTGSFKERGALNTLLLLDEDKKRRGVISASRSSGNQAQAVGYHAGRLGIPVTVVMPTDAPIRKQEVCKRYGARVVVHGATMSDARDHAMQMGRQKGLTYINGYDHPHVIAGHGTLGLEILEQVPEVDAVVVQIGGGALIAGVSIVIKSKKPKCRIYGVEPKQNPCFYRALEEERPVEVPPGETVADQLVVPMIGHTAFHNAKDNIDKIVLVDEDWIARTILHLTEQDKFVVEGAGGTGLAAIMSNSCPELKGKTVVCILTGGNIDTSVYARCLERGLAAESRLIKFKVTIKDQPLAQAELWELIGKKGYSIVHMHPDRVWVEDDFFGVEMKVVCETKGPHEASALQKLIEKKYAHSNFEAFGDAPCCSFCA